MGTKGNLRDGSKVRVKWRLAQALFSLSSPRIHSSWLRCLVGVTCCVAVARSSGQDAQARFEKSLSDARSLTNVEIQILDTLWVSPSFLKVESAGPASSGFSRTFQYSYIASGQRFRTQCKLVSASVTNVARLSESAFDGSSYSAYDGDQRYVSRNIQKTQKSTFDRGLSPCNPLIAPFMFLSGAYHDMQAPLRFTDLTDPAFTKGLVLPGGRKSGGSLEISTPESPSTNQQISWRIIIDDDAGDSFTPKTITKNATKPSIEIVYTLLDYTNLGAYHFPKTIAWTMINHALMLPPTPLSTGLVTTLSFGIPSQVPDSTFKIDESEAAVVWDWSQRKLTKSPPQHATLHRSRTAARVIWLLMLLLTTAAVVVAYARSSATRGSSTDPR